MMQNNFKNQYNTRWEGVLMNFKLKNVMLISDVVITSRYMIRILFNNSPKNVCDSNLI